MPRNSSETLFTLAASPPAKSMSAALSASEPTISAASSSAISLPALADGPSPAVSPACPIPSPSGPDRVPAKVSAASGQRTTNGTSGAHGALSSAGDDLQSYLENRLRAALDLDGSPEFVLTWKTMPMPSGSQCPAGGVGSPQERERLWFVAMGNAEGVGWRESICALDPPAGSGPQAGQSPWASEIVLGADGSRRRIKPGTQFLAHGIPDRVADLRAFGNAIVPQVGAKFIVAAIGR